MRRREFVISSGAFGSSLLAGCTYNFSNRGFELVSSPVRVPEFIIDQTFVEKQTVSESTQKLEQEYNGESRKITYRTWNNVLSADSSEISEVWFYTQPHRKLEDLDLTPVNLLNPRDLVSAVDTGWLDLEFGSMYDEYQVTTLDEDVKLLKYQGLVAEQESDVVQDMTFFYANFTNKGDEVAFLAGIPKSNEDIGYEVFSILQSAIHPAEERKQ